MDRTTTPARKHRRITVRGTVQSVGFRPFVYRLATEHGLAGCVKNTGAGVEIEVEGAAGALDRFVECLPAEAPPLARIDEIESSAGEPTGAEEFRILESETREGEVLPVAPDVATCDACRAELEEPDDRRYGYAFNNCTNCGPRFTVIEALPYDRAQTTMREFTLCEDCRAEYEDPADRRFHAEPVACPECGPRLEFRGDPAEPVGLPEVGSAGGPGAGGREGGPTGNLAGGIVADDRSGDPRAERQGGAAPGEDAIASAISTLDAGRVVAIKGLGGFQLACDATDERAVARLRERKHREAKPFALMVPDLEAARTLCHVDDAEAAVLTGPRAPVVLLDRRADATALAAGVASRLDTLGVMLPYTPLHHLLLDAFGGPLVMTSGNRSSEPIATDNDEAERRLEGIADAFLLHDRRIAGRYDDSVVRLDRGEEQVSRRARGYAPEPIALPHPAPTPILACGPQLKNTFCLVREGRAFVSQHIGDLDDAATLAHYHDTLARYRALFDVEPAVVAHDLHPDYAATRYARSLEGVEHVGVQHHHAHVASCMAEHGVTEPVIGVAFDGTGYGTDGTIWGGEVLVADLRGFRRAARQAHLALPGGDAAAREPWRMALAALAHAYGGEADEIAAELLARITEERRRAVLHMAREGINAPPTSSAGRLFDAVAALAGVRAANEYEGQAAMELEARADGSERAAYPLPLELVDAEAVGSPGAGASCLGERSERVLPAAERRAHRRSTDAANAIWNTAPLIRAVVDDVRRGVGAGAISARFHNTLARGVVDACGAVHEAESLDTVVLSGGCFQNRRLADAARAALERDGFRVLTHRRVPPNDGGIAIGQAAVAAAAT